MLSVGLTGNIASGKSTVARLFEQWGARLIDADQLVRELQRPGTPVFRRIVERFGADVMAADGTIDRGRLRAIVFSDPAGRRRLESILHPRVYATMERQAADLNASYGLLVIPLLVETGQLKLADRILVVDLPEAEQIRRVCRRDGLSEAEVRAILQAQAERAARLAVADDVIDNSRDLAFLLAQADQFHRMYLKLASASSTGAR